MCDIAHILLFKGDLASNKQDQGGQSGQDSKQSDPYPYLIESQHALCNPRQSNKSICGETQFSAILYASLRAKTEMKQGVA